MYVQLLAKKQITGNDGKFHNYEPGDFVEVGKQTAKQWIAQGVARVLDYRRAGLLPAASGIQAWGYDYHPVPQDLRGDGLSVATPTRNPELTYFRTLLWTQGAPIRRDVLAAGFSLLDTFQIAVPLLSYETLAVNLGNERDRAATEKIIHDLRVPVYDIRLMFVRRCADTEALLKLWEVESAGGGDIYLSFLRALYQQKPLILPLPITWGSADGRDGYA